MIFISSSAAASKGMQDPLGMGTFDPTHLTLVRGGEGGLGGGHHGGADNAGPARDRQEGPWR